MKLNFLHFMLDGSWCHVWGTSVMAYFYDVILHQRHAKWVVYLHIKMDAVDVHNRKLVLKIGYCMKMQEIEPHAYFGAA